MKVQKYECNLCQTELPEKYSGLSGLIPINDHGNEYFDWCTPHLSDKHLCEDCIMKLRKCFEKENAEKDNY